MYNKIILQHLWRLNLDWDDAIPPELNNKFQLWLASTNILKSWKIGRCYFPMCKWSDIESIEVHEFCDSSDLGCGAVIYLHILTDIGYKTSYVISRGRVAPTKKVTIPRLELLGAVLLSRLMSNVVNALHLHSKQTLACHYWCDSEIVLAWLKSDPYTLKTFVCNRVTEIANSTVLENWHHCPGQLNPADLITRGCLADILVNDPFWLTGPTFLRNFCDF